jgi:hypothetical protein
MFRLRSKPCSGGALDSMEDLKRWMHTGKLVTRKLQANFNCEQ